MKVSFPINKTRITEEENTSSDEEQDLSDYANIRDEEDEDSDWSKED